MELSKVDSATTDHSEKNNGNNVQMFDIRLELTKPCASRNYANCYCYGPSYPPCCK